MCCPIHDALLVEYPLDQADRVISETRECMRRASIDVLRDFEIRTDVERVDYPARYSDPRGQMMWDTVWGIVRDLSHEGPGT